MTQRPTVLFVEDDANIRELLGEILAPAEFHVVVASSGSEAMGILCREPVDILFTDIVMPDVDGIELARRARLLRPELRVIFMTGYLSRMVEAAASGPTFTKPISPEQIEAAVREQTL